jgi:hypothetical protein
LFGFATFLFAFAVDPNMHLYFLQKNPFFFSTNNIIPSKTKKGKKRKKRDLNGNDDDTFKLTKTKQSQHEISQYSYTNETELRFASTYLNEYLASRCKPLGFIDRFFLLPVHDLFNKFTVDLASKVDTAEKHALTFKLSNDTVTTLNPFEYLTMGGGGGDRFMLFNVAREPTALDWCPLSKEQGDAQYLAFATLPLPRLNDLTSCSSSPPAPTDTHHKQMNLVNLYAEPNLINILRLKSLANDAGEINDTQMFSLYHKSIGMLVFFSAFVSRFLLNLKFKILGTLHTDSFSNFTIARKFKSENRF